MNADELHAIADNLRRAYRRPSIEMTPGEYISHESINALADAIDELAKGRAT
jgi:hypothetical protein